MSIPLTGGCGATFPCKFSENSVQYAVMNQLVGIMRVFLHLFRHKMIRAGTVTMLFLLSSGMIGSAFAYMNANIHSCDLPASVNIHPHSTMPYTCPATDTDIFLPIIPGTRGLHADILFQLINNYRKTVGLAAFQKDDTTCQLANARAPEIYREIFITHSMHQGMYARNLPYWNTENIIFMNTEQNAFDWWIHEPLHHAAIVGHFIYSCIACFGNSCTEEFTNYQQK